MIGNLWFILFTLLTLCLSSCSSDDGASFYRPDYYPTKAYFEPSGVKPLSVVIPTPGPTLILKPEVGPRAVYFLKKVSGGSSAHLVYQADLETQQIHTLDTLDFEHCNENNRGMITGLSPNRKALLVHCGGTLYIYDTVTRQRIYTTPKKIISMPKGNPVLWPHITVLSPVYPSPVPTQPPIVDEQETFSSAQSKVEEVSITDNFQSFIPTNQGTELLIFRRQEMKNPFDHLTQLVKVKLEDLSVERAWSHEVYRSPNRQRLIRQDVSAHKMYVSDSLGKNRREIPLENKGIPPESMTFNWQGDDLVYSSFWQEERLKMRVFDLANLRAYAFTLPETVFAYPNSQYPSPTLLDISSDGKQVVLYTEEKEPESQWISSLSVLDLETSAVLPLAQTRIEDASDFRFWAKFLPEGRLVYAQRLSSYPTLVPELKRLLIRQLDHIAAKPTTLFELPLETGAVAEPTFSNAQQWVLRSEGKHYALDLNTLSLSEAQLPSWAKTLIRYTSDKQFALLKEGNTLVSVKVATGERFEIFEETPFANQQWIDY